MILQIPETWELLHQCTNKELEPLVGFIKEASVSENLTSTSAYKRHYPNHKQYTDEIYNEIRLFGGNTFVNLFRREGPPYAEIVEDVAKKVGVKEIEGLEVVELEHRLLEELLRKALKNSIGEEKVELESMLKESGLSDKDLSAFISGGALFTLVSASIYRMVLTRVSAAIANIIAQRLLGYGVISTVTAFSLQRAGALWLGPIGIAITGIWTAIDIGGPAFRVTMPCVMHIAMLRQQWILKHNLSAMGGEFDDE